MLTNQYISMHLAAARRLAGQGDLTNALRAYQRARRFIQPDAQFEDWLRIELHNAGAAAFNRQDYRSAADLFEAGLRLGPHEELDRLVRLCAAALATQAVELWNAGKPREAADSIARAVDSPGVTDKILDTAAKMHLELAANRMAESDLPAAATLLARLERFAGIEDRSRARALAAELWGRCGALAARLGGQGQGMAAATLLRDAYGALGPGAQPAVHGLVQTMLRDWAPSRDGVLQPEMVVAQALFATSRELHGLMLAVRWNGLKQILEQLESSTTARLLEQVMPLTAIDPDDLWPDMLGVIYLNIVKRVAEALLEDEPSPACVADYMNLLGCEPLCLPLLLAVKDKLDWGSVAAQLLTDHPTAHDLHVLNCCYRLLIEDTAGAEEALARFVERLPEAPAAKLVRMELDIAAGNQHAAALAGRSLLAGNALPVPYFMWRVNFAFRADLPGRQRFLEEIGLGEIIDSAVVGTLARSFDPMADIESELSRFSERTGRKWYYDKSQLHFFPRTTEPFADLRGLIEEFVLPGSVPPSPLFDDRTRLLTLGSCFAENLRRFLRSRGKLTDRILVPEGLNNTFALHQFIRWALTGDISSTAYWYDRDTAGDASQWMPTKEQADYNRAFREMDGFVITIGLAEVWEDKSTGQVFWRGIPRDIFDPEIHVNRLSTVDENEANLSAMVQLIQQECGPKPVIITLSPVPLFASFQGKACVLGDCVSKSTLRVAIEWLMRRNLPAVYYWPSFEIFRWLSGHLPRACFGSDGQPHHVDADIVDMIMGLFVEHYFAGDREAENKKVALSTNAS